MSDDSAKRTRGSRARSILDLVATLAIISACGVVVWRNLSTPETPSRTRALPSSPVSVDSAPALGKPDASVAMLIYSDFECPFCSRFAQGIFPEVRKKYIDPGLVRAIFIHLPLENLHQRAVPAAVASECAAERGKFWEMHDLLFQDPQRLDEGTLTSYAQKLGWRPEPFATCMARTDLTERIRASAAAARSLGIESTPVVLMGTRLPDGTVRVVRRVDGAKPVSEFDKVLTEILGRSAS